MGAGAGSIALGTAGAAAGVLWQDFGLRIGRIS